MLKNVIKLWREILKLSEVITDKATLIVDGEVIEGAEVYVEVEGEIQPAEDGEYEADDKIIVVSEGKITEIREKEQPAEEPIEEQPAEEEADQPAEEEDKPEEEDKDRKIAELEARVAELEATIEERDAKIAELEAELEAKNEELQESAAKPAKDEIKKNEQRSFSRLKPNYKN